MRLLSKQRGFIGAGRPRAFIRPKRNSLALRPAFDLPLADLGSGEVDITLARGVGTGTFTRATAATTVNSAGQIVSVAAGVPRSYYDPTTLEYMGYLAEGARTNLLLQSEDLATTWENTVSSESVNAGVAPDGTTTADKLIPDNGTASGRITQTGLTISANTTYTYSVFAKGAEFSLVRLRVGDGDFSDTADVTYDASDGTVSSAAAVTGAWTNPSSTAKQYPNGWWRFTLTFTATTNAGDRVQLWCTNTGDGTSGILLWGAQLEAGSFASSYIPTTTASVTRNADVLTYPFAGNASASQGWAYAELGTLWATASGASMAINFGDGATVSALRVPNNQASTTISILDGTNTVGKTGLTDMNTGVRKRASSWGGSAMVVTGDGSAVETGSFDGALESAAIGIGCRTGGGNQWFGTIRNPRIGVVKANDLALQAMTR